MEERRTPERRTPALQAYWRRQRARTLLLLCVWVVVGFGMSILFVESLNRIEIGGVPFGFWMAQQGSIFVFVLLILLYAVLSGRADRQAGVQEAETHPPAPHGPGH